MPSASRLRITAAISRHSPGTRASRSTRLAMISASYVDIPSASASATALGDADAIATSVWSIRVCRMLAGVASSGSNS